MSSAHLHLLRHAGQAHRLTQGSLYVGLDALQLHRAQDRALDRAWPGDAVSPRDGEQGSSAGQDRGFGKGLDQVTVGPGGAEPMKGRPVGGPTQKDDGNG